MHVVLNSKVLICLYTRNTYVIDKVWIVFVGINYNILQYNAYIKLHIVRFGNKIICLL